MSRNQQKGTGFESLIARGLAEALDDDRIERRARTGAKDRGDITGVRLHGRRVVLELKNEATGKVFKLPEWVKEAHEEAGNDDALVGLVVHKRAGTTDPMKQWFTGTVADLVAILTGERYVG
jgi:hypothetical protein